MDEPRERSSAAYWAPIVVTVIGALLIAGYYLRFPW